MYLEIKYSSFIKSDEQFPIHKRKAFKKIEIGCLLCDFFFGGCNIWFIYDFLIQIFPFIQKENVDDIYKDKDSITNMFHLVYPTHEFVIT